jgi:hypothetical protein
MNDKLKKIVQSFNSFERKFRGKLSHHPINYAILGGIGVVLFWRGVWHLADSLNISSIISMILGSLILLVTGAFVSSFIGNRLIITGLMGEKKQSEKTEEVVETEEIKLGKLQSSLAKVEKQLEHLDQDMHNKKNQSSIC